MRISQVLVLCLPLGFAAGDAFSEEAKKEQQRLPSLAVANACPGQEDKPSSNIVTPKEVGDGWLVLFDGKTTTGWGKTSWKVDKGNLVSPGDNSPLQSTREFKDFELVFEFQNDGGKEAVLGFGKYSEQDSHPVRIYLSNNKISGWHKVHLWAKGKDAGGSIESLKTGEKVFPEAVIRENGATPVPLVFKGPNLRLKSIKLRPINMKPNEK